MEFGTDVHSYNITNLKKYQSYRVYVAGRCHGGDGVEKYEEAMTDEDGKQIWKISGVTSRFVQLKNFTREISSSLL